MPFLSKKKEHFKQIYSPTIFSILVKLISSLDGTTRPRLSLFCTKIGRLKPCSSKEPSVNSEPLFNSHKRLSSEALQNKSKIM
jgi:hypothetical protein